MTKVFINKFVLELEIPGHRYSAHSELDNYVNEYLDEWQESFDIESEDEDKFWDEVQELHDLISNQDYKGIENHSISSELGFEWENPFEVFEKDLKEILEGSGYKVEKSNASASLYVNVDGKELRISDHKRPGFTGSHDFDIQEHEYDMEIIEEDNQVTKSQLENLGLVINSNESIYYL